MAFNNNINSGNLHASSSTNSGSKKRSFMEVVLGNDQRNSNPPARHQDVSRKSGHPIPVAFNNNIDNGNLHSSSFTGRGSKKRSFREMAPATDRGYSNAPAHHRGLVERSDYMFGSPRDLRGEHGFDSASSTTSYAMSTLRNDYLWRPQSHKPAIGQSVQPDCPATANRDHSFTSLAPLGPRDTVRMPINYQGGGEASMRRASTNAQNPNQPSTGLSRTRPTRTRAVQPYASYPDRIDKYRNGEAGPKTLVPPPTQHPTKQATNHSGGISETTAYAETNQPLTEEEVIPRKRARGRGKSRPVLVNERKVMKQLLIWAGKWANRQEVLSHADALEIALKAVEKRRKPIYQKPQLQKGRNERTTVGVRDNDDAAERRKVLRGLCEKLSQYYPLKEGMKAWTVAVLVDEVLNEFKDPHEPPPQGSTSTRAPEENPAITLLAGMSKGGHPAYMTDEHGGDWEDTAGVEDEESNPDAMEDGDRWNGWERNWR